MMPKQTGFPARASEKCRIAHAHIGPRTREGRLREAISLLMLPACTHRVLFHYSAEHSCSSPMAEVQHAAEPLSAANWPIGSA